MELSTTISEINRLHSEAQSAALSAVEKAVECGHKLTELKSGCEHGEFTKLIENHLELNPRTARRYMQAAKNHSLLLQNGHGDHFDGSLLELVNLGSSETDFEPDISTEPRITDIETELSEHELAQIDRDIEREIAERERRLSEIERVVPTDDHIDRLVTLLISGGQQLETYCLRKNTVVQPEQFATFVANRLIDLSDHCGSDPEVYTSNLESIREFIRLVGSALDRVPAERESHLKLVK